MNSYRAPRDVYERLAAATPAERAAIVLRLIEEHPAKRLELPAYDGLHAVLDEVDLSPEALESLGEPHGAGPWRDPESGGINLSGADLQGASLRNADLRRGCLSNADLRGALMGGAKLSAARLDGADLRRADLAGADLAGAALGQADLRGAMLEETDLRAATLRFAKLGDAVLEEARLAKADLWGADFDGADLTNADLRGALLEEAHLARADLTNANLQETILRRADLREAKLVGADLRGATLGNAVLRGAVLRDAKLQETDLTHCDLTHVHMSGARLDDTRFGREQLGGAIGEELTREFDEARKGYLSLERAFQNLGDHDAAAWAYRRRRRMQKRGALEQARAAHAARQWGPMTRFYAVYASDQFVEWVCDYGESIPRVFASLLALYLLFCAAYGLTGSVVREQETPNGIIKVPTRHPVDLAIFGLLAMTTGSIGIRLLPAHDLALALVGLHVFLGVALIGLLGFVLGNRIRR
ncbi:MAG: pentapeptide repeat-containing protein [Isosphaeraceae bacterium]|nr:pentapeptide repeat-containing protein [Isosphaeraceae bacterium]